MWFRARSWWRALRHRSAFEGATDDEVRFHLEINPATYAGAALLLVTVHDTNP